MSEDSSILRPRRRLSVVSTNTAIEGVRKMTLSERKDSEEKFGGKADEKEKAVKCWYGESKRGYAPYNPRKVNQDSLLIHRLGKRIFLGTLDGHGEHGHHVSRTITDHFCKNIDSHVRGITDTKDLAQKMETVFLAGEKICINKNSISTEFSGTTNVTLCVTGMHAHRRCY